jgi:hypothetical protein
MDVALLTLFSKLDAKVNKMKDATGVFAQMRQSDWCVCKTPLNKNGALSFVFFKFQFNHYYY